MAETTRVRKSVEERVAAIDKKVQYHKSAIESLEKKKSSILIPKTREKRISIKNLIDQAKANGLTVDDIAQKLGLS